MFHSRSCRFTYHAGLNHKGDDGSAATVTVVVVGMPQSSGLSLLVKVVLTLTCLNRSKVFSSACARDPHYVPAPRIADPRVRFPGSMSQVGQWPQK